MAAKKKPTKKPSRKDRLSIQQQRFVNNILKGYTQTKSYMMAGYKATGSSAEVNACVLIRNPKIQQAIEKAQERANRAAEISQARILEEESRLALYDPKDLMNDDGAIIPLHKLPENIRRAIHGLEVTEDALGQLKYKYRFSDKGRALERLEKIEGMFKAEKHEFSGSIEVEVIDSYAGEEAKDKDSA